MRLSRATQTLIFTISCFFAHYHALPINERAVDVRPVLAPRARATATYSVVPMNGGGPGSGDGGPVTVTQTVVQTATPTAAKTTVYHPLPTTNTVFLTKTVSIVPIQPQPTTVIVTYTPSMTSSVSSTTSAQLYTSEYTPTSSVTASPATLSTSEAGPDRTFSIEFASTTTFSTSSASYPSITSTTSIQRLDISSKTYDDGMWHTTYPPWNGTSLARRLSRPPPRQIA
ncbi:hypothetical protein V8F33_014129 [Rhypophila sp. PSN 637]